MIFFFFMIVFVILFVIESYKNVLTSSNISSSISSREVSKKFVTPVLQGGLGNQMFQIALAFAYGRENNLKLYVDKNQNISSFHKDKTYWNTMLSFVPHKDFTNVNWKDVSERGFHYTKLPVYNNNNVRLSGYFQSDKYFKSHKEELIDLFSLRFQELEPLNITRKYPESVLISVHIRRGDYLKLKLHTSVALKYYRKAFLSMESNLKDLNIEYVVFSDDIEWCKESFHIFGDRTFHYCEQGVDVDQMYFMSSCDHNIIANSSFSWWGAYLNTNESKIVVSPDGWFTDKSVNTTDVHCDDWIVLT